MPYEEIQTLLVIYNMIEMFGMARLHTHSYDVEIFLIFFLDIQILELNLVWSGIAFVVDNALII